MPKAISDWDAQIEALDFETSGTRQEYALQPWRITTRDFWATSLATVRKADGKLTAFGGINPDRALMRSLLEDAIASGRRILCWNATFDISVLLAYGMEDLVFKLDWLDGMLIWKHLTVEPEYEVDRSKKKSFGLKQAVAQYLPQYADYADDVDFHDSSPEARRKLHQYNIRDNAFTWQVTKHLWGQLTQRQQRCALIEADCLPHVAQANLEGMLIDTVYTRSLEAGLTQKAEALLEELKDEGVTEKIVRSPTQLGQLMFDSWGLPVLKENTGKKTGKVSRATDKEVLHELSFRDPRAKKLREYREALNNRTKFATTPLKAALYNGDGRAHPLANVYGTYTSRLTYSSKQTDKTKRKEATDAVDEG